MIHPNAALIERLFAALNAHDASAMAACYHRDNPTFHDIAFDLKTAREIHDMWRMICEGDSEVAVTVEQVEADDQRGVARIVDRYFFGRNKKKGTFGRPVVNRITSRFRFRDGLIVEQIDDCDPRAWATQALGGPLGWIAGRSRPVRAGAAHRKLKAFLKENPAPTSRGSTQTEARLR
jgi:ketosteroid isomerase-like protein